MSRMIAVIGSVFVLLVILHDAFEVMLLPRRSRGTQYRNRRVPRLFITIYACSACAAGWLGNESALDRRRIRPVLAGELGESRPLSQPSLSIGTNSHLTSTSTGGDADGDFGAEGPEESRRDTAPA